MDLKNGNDTLAASFATAFKGFGESIKNLVKMIGTLIRSFKNTISVAAPLLRIILIPIEVSLGQISILISLLTIMINKLTM